jgi:hypothetical protein
VSHVIQYETLRKEICLDSVERDLVTLQLDELHALALKPAVISLEPESAGQIAKMETWVMSARARPTAMAQVSDSVLLTFIVKELMKQDVWLAEDIEVDEKFATFLARNNAVQKSLAVTHALNVGGNSVPAQVRRPQRALDCPKCHYEHHLRDCTSPVATLTLNGLPNLYWRHEGPGGGRGGVGVGCQALAGIGCQALCWLPSVVLVAKRWRGLRRCPSCYRLDGGSIKFLAIAPMEPMIGVARLRGATAKHSYLCDNYVSDMVYIARQAWFVNVATTLVSLLSCDPIPLC